MILLSRASWRNVWIPLDSGVWIPTDEFVGVWIPGVWIPTDEFVGVWLPENNVAPRSSVAMD
jgi:hypothetical protein